MSNRDRTVVLLGGGLDGYAALLHLKQLGIDDIHIVHVDYGQLAMQEEREAVKAQAKFAQVTRISWMHDDHYLIKKLNPQGSLLFGDANAPAMLNARNLVLLMFAATKGDRIVLGLDKPYHGGPPFFDCTLDYYQQAIKLLNMPELVVQAPFVDRDKLNVCYEAVQIDKHFFERTFTCWTPVNGEECGQCKHCKTKRELELKVTELLENPNAADESTDQHSPAG